MCHVLHNKDLDKQSEGTQYKAGFLQVLFNTIFLRPLLKQFKTNLDLMWLGKAQELNMCCPRARSH